MARLKLDRELQRYADDLVDEVESVIRSFEDHNNDTIHNAARDIGTDKCSQAAAIIFETYVLDDDMNERDAIKDAAEDAVQASLYTIIKRDYRLSDIDREDEDDFKDAFKDVEDILGSSSRRDGNSRDRGRGRDRGRSNRDRGSSRDRRSNGSRSRDRNRDEDKRDRNRSNRDDDRRREEEEARAERDRRRGKVSDQARDDKVAEDVAAIEEGKVTILNSGNYKTMRENWRHKNVNLFAHAPIYLAATQNLVFSKGDIYTEARPVDKEAHRTDIYLKPRTDVKPTGSIRKEAFDMALRAREVYVKDLVDQHNDDNNAVSGDVPVIRETIFTREVLFLAYGQPDPKITLDQALTALKLRGIPKAPVIYRFERTPSWVLPKAAAMAIRDLATISRFSDLPTKLVAVANACIDHPAIWAHIHDRVTEVLTREINLGLGVSLTMASILTDWNNLSKWLSEYHKGVHITYLDNIIGRIMVREFRVRDHGAEGFPHLMTDGSDEKFAMLYRREVGIHIPESSEHIDIASPTRMGRVYESMTPELYRILTNFNDDDAAVYFISTASGDVLKVYSAVSGMERAFYIDIE